MACPNCVLYSSLCTLISLQATTDDLMRFVKELRRANSALVDAFEKAKKRQLAEKRRMKHELVTYMNRVQANGAGGAIEVGLKFDVGTKELVLVWPHEVEPPLQITECCHMKWSHSFFRGDLS